MPLALICGPFGLDLIPLAGAAEGAGVDAGADAGANAGAGTLFGSKFFGGEPELLGS